MIDYKTAVTIFKQYKKRAEKKELSFDLSEEVFISVLLTQCYICGKNGLIHKLGIDRLNNEKGYVLGNIAPCCWECNRVKSNLKTKPFMLWLKRICPKHPLLKGHCQPKNQLNGDYIDVYFNVDILK